jgi:hypothetical protein
VTAIEQIAPSAWRATVERAVASGERFAGGWAVESGSGLGWRVLFVGTDGLRAISVDALDGVIDTIADLIPAANWDEREAHDQYGLRFSGHEPMRALATHTGSVQWMTPVHGNGVHQVAVGPIHAGVIESGHFRFHVVGERILAVDPRLFYKHRGVERAAEGLAPGQALPYLQRACAACAVTNTVATHRRSRTRSGSRPTAICARSGPCCWSSSASTTTCTTSALSAPVSASLQVQWRSPRSKTMHSK